MSYYITMKYILHAIFLSFAISAIAQDAPKQDKSQERKGPPKELLAKYDTNKDGKLDKEERSKISEEDKKKFAPRRKGPKGPPPPKKD